MDSLQRHKHAILLAALVCVALIESFSHRQVLGPVFSDLVIAIMMLLVFLIVFEAAREPHSGIHCIGHRRCDRLGPQCAAGLP